MFTVIASVAVVAITYWTDRLSRCHEPSFSEQHRSAPADIQCRSWCRRPNDDIWRPDCLAGHVGLELRNVDANYRFESSRGFPGSEPNSGHGDHSRLSCSAGDTQLGAGFCGSFSKRSARTLAITRRRRKRRELAAISFDQKMIRRRQSQQHHCSVCAGLAAPRERVW